jgi:hypothetical protein
VPNVGGQHLWLTLGCCLAPSSERSTLLLLVLLLLLLLLLQDDAPAGWPQAHRDEGQATLAAVSEAAVSALQPAATLK